MFKREFVTLKKTVLITALLLSTVLLQAQTVSGVVKDENGEALFAASVIIKATTTGAQTDFDGKFTFDAKQQPPFTLLITYLGHENLEFQITPENISRAVSVKLKSSAVQVGVVQVTDTRITEKLKESPLTVESMGLSAIKQTPSADFYAGLGNLKGVDLTTASMGFVVVNTRGFNSTRPVRTLQLVDGADNQAPGLNFSLGNFVGVSELDIQKVDLIVGASSAFYGPNAFNGVIVMDSKNPFLHPGISVMLKAGERALFEGGLRYANAFQNKNGEDKFAFKINAAFMRANDWEATNMNPSENSLVGKDNWGGYDAVNRYGDENITDNFNNDTDADGRLFSPGLEVFHRTGYEEKDVVDYDSRNIKASGSMHYKITEKIETEYAYNFGTGTTVYQGDNRYSLKDFKFQQHRFEISQPDKFHIRAYHTRENAGDSYDAVFTALLLQEAVKKNTSPDFEWSNDYRGYYRNNITEKVYALDGFPDPTKPEYQSLWFGESRFATYALADSVMQANSDSLIKWHNETRAFSDGEGYRGFINDPRLVPGTPEFDSVFNSITSKNTFLEGGSKFYDKSSLTQVQGEYKFAPEIKSAAYGMNVTTGGSFRFYTPESRGTIFSDTAVITSTIDAGGNRIKDTSYTKITNYEYGAYIGTEQRVLNKKLIITGVVRMDKNQNFDFLFSPAVSFVYKANEENTFRLSFSSAIRNPTLQDQYLYYNVGRAILIGNIDGIDSLVTRDSYFASFGGLAFNSDSLDYFSVPPVRPEKVKSLEVGYKATLFKRLFIDASYYFSWYKDFLGYKIGAAIRIDTTINLPTYTQFYRVSANSPDQVTTQGFSVGVNYFFKKYFSLSGNYSWNVLDRRGSDDEIIPAFNTPAHKFNIGISGKDIVLRIKNATIKNWGFNVNYKWVQSYLFEGSPQFTGNIPTYDLVDAQINYKVPKIYTTFKVGATNVLNKKRFQTYGGPDIGRLAYLSITFETDKL